MLALPALASGPFAVPKSSFDNSFMQRVFTILLEALLLLDAQTPQPVAAQFHHKH
jgi:hypothetical protein